MGARAANVSLGPKTFLDIDMHIDDKWKAAAPICRKSRCSKCISKVQSLNPLTLLSIPKKQLKVVKMQQVNFSVQIDFLKALGNDLTTLEEIEIVGDVPRLDVPMDLFAEASPNFRDVKVRGYPVV